MELYAKSVLATSPAPGGGTGGTSTGGTSIGIVPKEKSGWQGLTELTIDRIVSGLITLSLVAAAVVFFFMLVWGGLKWITSQGDENKVKEARGQVTQALIGLAVVFAAWAVLTLVGNLFGIENLRNLTIPSF